MKAKMLKIAGVKSEAAFYKKFPTQAAFMKVHGKEFKKAQTGINEATSNTGSFNIYNPYGDAMQSADMSGMQNSFVKPVIDDETIEMPEHIQNSNFGKKQQRASDAYEQQELTDITEDTSNPLGTDKLSSFAKGMDPVKSVMGAFTGIRDAFQAHKENKKLSDKMETWANVSDVQKRAGISNAFAEKPKRQYFRPDDPMFIHNANELSNTQGRGSDVITQNGGVFQGGDKIQNTHAPGTLYDDLGYEPFDESNDDDDVKNYQGGGKFGNFFNQLNTDLGGGQGFMGNLGVGSPFDSMIGGGTTGGNLGGKIGSLLGPGGAMLGSLAGRYFDKNPGRQKNAQNTMNSNNAFLGRLNTTGDIHNQFSQVTQNGKDLEPYEDGGWVSHDWQPQVIASFGGLDEQEVYDYAHEGMDTLRAGGHLREYTPVSDRAMESYAMGGQLKTHWGGKAETISYNPYTPGSGEMVKLNGAPHGKEGGIGISYGGEQGGPQQTAKDGADTGASIEAEGRETIMEMEDGGKIDPQTGEAKTSAVVLGNIAPSMDIIKATGDQVLIDLFSKNPKKTFKRIGEVIAKDENKAASYKKIASDKANKADSTEDGALALSTARIMEDAAERMLKLSAQQRIKSANLQSAVNDTKQDISYMKGKNISAEELGKGKIANDYDPITKDAELESPYAKHGAFLRKAQNSATITADEEPSITEEQYNNFIKLYEEGKNTKSKKSPSIKNFQHLYHQSFPKEAVAAIQKTTRENGLSNKAKAMGLTKEDILSGKDVSKILESNEDEYFGPRTEQYMAKIASKFKQTPSSGDLQLTPLGAKTTPAITATTDKKEIGVVPLKQNKLGMFADMLRQFQPQAKLPGIDPRQFAGEYMAMSQNQLEPVPSQRMRMQLDPMTRLSYQDIRNENTANFKDALRNFQGNEAATIGALGNMYKANQPTFGEEFRTNQGLEQQIYGGNRAKVNQEMATNLQLDAAQMDKQSLALSKTKEINQKAIASIADKYLQHDARNLEYNVKSNMFPTYAYDSSGRIRTQGPGFQANIPQVYGGKSNIKQVPIYGADGKTITGYQMQEGDETDIPSTATPPLVAITKNGGSVNKKNRSSVVKNAKNGSIVKLHKNF